MTSNLQENNTVRILVADDSLLMRTLFQEILIEAGFQVFTAENGLEAWEYLQKEPIHLLIADLLMPHLDGFDLTRMIRSDKQLKKLPVILISAIDTPEDRQRGLGCGANAYMLKEWGYLDSLASMIDDLLE